MRGIVKRYRTNTALATGKLSLGAGQVAALSAAQLVGTIPFCAMGLMIGSPASGSATPAYANLIYLPGCYLSGMFLPLPVSMYWQRPIWPQFHVEQSVMYLAGITDPPVLFAGVTLWRLKQKG